MSIKAVAFDVDGTLYPNYAMYIRSVPFGALHPRLLFAFRKIRIQVRARRPIQDLRRLQAQLLSKALGISVDDADHRIRSYLIPRWEEHLRHVRLYPGVRECIATLRALGLKVAVSSDFPVERKLRLLGVSGLFDCELWTETSGYLKPNPEPFVELAECLSLPPEEILYVGNSYAYDIVGAKRVGMPAAHLSRRPAPGSVADLTFSRYADLLAWVREHRQ
jgi:putative hydrolase of the HAD superfamily